MNNCPTCGQPVEPEDPVQYGPDGIPLAAAMQEGLGVPVIPLPCALRVFLDGKEVPACVGFDQVNGIVWSNQSDANGVFLIKDGNIVIVRQRGVVFVKRMSA